MSKLIVDRGTLTVTSASVVGDNVVVVGTSSIDPTVSNYIQYYIGKEYAGTSSNCIVCAGINTDAAGHFTLNVPVSSLKGAGTYLIALEQNSKSNSIIACEHWKSFWKDSDGTLHFGDISSMGELSNLALTVGMQLTEVEVTLP